MKLQQIKKKHLSKYVEIIASRQVLRSLKVQSAPLFSCSGRSSLWLPEMSRKSIHQPESMVGDDCIQFPFTEWRDCFSPSTLLVLSRECSRIIHSFIHNHPIPYVSLRTKHNSPEQIQPAREMIFPSWLRTRARTVEIDRLSPWPSDVGASVRKTVWIAKKIGSSPTKMRG